MSLSLSHLWFLSIHTIDWKPGGDKMICGDREAVTDFIEHDQLVFPGANPEFSS
jgi:hypothetical protein